jgi:DNA-binding CsgD family transcriptional regulator
LLPIRQNEGVAEIMTLRGDLQFLAFMGRLASSVREEFVRAARELDTWSNPGAREVARAQMRPAGAYEHQTRKLFSAAALASERSREHLRELAGQGAEVRIAATPLPQETIIIDRRIAILAGPETRGSREYTVTTAPALIGGVYALFEAAWEASADIATFLRPHHPPIDLQGRTILRTLGTGLSDEAAARKLGMSLRTYRRRVADLLDILDANSRFQAGLRAGELGLTR